MPGLLVLALGHLDLNGLVVWATKVALPAPGGEPMRARPSSAGSAGVLFRSINIWRDAGV
jgi:hypothetical protein